MTSAMTPSAARFVVSRLSGGPWLILYIRPKAFRSSRSELPATRRGPRVRSPHEPRPRRGAPVRHILTGKAGHRIARVKSLRNRPRKPAKGRAKMSDGRITAGQVKTARQLLGWWQSDLAKMVGVSEKAIRTFESGELFATSLDLDLVREAFESSGIEFITVDGTAGVRLSKGKVD